MSKFLELLLNPAKNTLATKKKAAIALRLKNYGSRFEECFKSKEDLEINEAFSRLSRTFLLGEIITPSIFFRYIPVISFLRAL
ncbi:hypothetical protein ACHQM5_003408 [Ranunculus cassubicifolius]